MMKKYVVTRQFVVTQTCLIEAESIDKAKEYAEDDTDEHIIDIVGDFEGEYEVTSQGYRDIHEYKGKDID